MEDQARTSRNVLPGSSGRWGIEVNSRGRCRRFKLSRMIRRETQEEISNRVRHPSLTISCVRPGVIAGGRDEARWIAGGTAVRNKTSSEARVYKMDSSGSPRLRGLKAKERTRGRERKKERGSAYRCGRPTALVLRRVSYVFALPDSKDVRTLSMT